MKALKQFASQFSKNTTENKNNSIAGRYQKKKKKKIERYERSSLILRNIVQKDVFWEFVFLLSERASAVVSNTVMKKWN